jgi:hypothetical protein
LFDKAKRIETKEELSKMWNAIQWAYIVWEPKAEGDDG